MDQPGGQVLVGAVGVVIGVIGAALVTKAWTDRFAKEMDSKGLSGTSGTVYLWLGRVGCVAKGIAFGIVGGLFCYAAAHPRADRSPAGSTRRSRRCWTSRSARCPSCAIALGFAAYGLFCFAQARYFDR